MKKATIIACTLSMTGSSRFNKLDKVDYLIVDEACQSTEMTTLIPLQLDPSRVILVGDQK